jgi:hypothetical protein
MKKKKCNKVPSSLKAAVTEIGWQEALDVDRDGGREELACLLLHN